jgi:membrane protease YdiL (CAAX protease family)
MHSSKQPALPWQKIIPFLALTFFLTWGLDLLTYWKNGSQVNSLAILTNQARLLLPAFSALALQMFAWKGSQIHVNHYRQKPLIFLYSYLGMTLAYVGLTAWALFDPSRQLLASSLSSTINLLVILLLLAVRYISQADDFARVGLAGGRLSQWLILWAAVVAYYALSALLNSLFTLGQPVDISQVMGQLNLPAEYTPTMFWLLMILQTLFLGPLLGVVLMFGQEYGWRGFLQDQFFASGKLKGALWIGLIWAAWQWPPVWMGQVFPGQPVLGTLIITAYAILLGIVLSTVRLKTGAIFLVAFLHSLNQQASSFFYSFVYQPTQPVFSFGVGLYGLIILIPLVIVLLRDRAWHD